MMTAVVTVSVWRHKCLETQLGTHTSMPRLTRVLTAAVAVLCLALGASRTLGAADVPLEVGAPLHLDCGVRGHPRHCLWETEDGRVLQVEDVHAGRHAGLRAPDNLTHNQCGIVVEQASAGDAGAWTCKVFLPGEALTTVRSVGGRHARACEYPFEAVGGGCFYFGENVPLTWSEARDYCQNLADGADLAVVDDCHLMQQLWSHISLTYGGSNHWLGATDQHKEGMWVWVDGTAVTLGTPFWEHTQPNNGYDGEHCLHMWALNDGYFNDNNCSVAYRFVCQDSLLTSLVTTPSPSPRHSNIPSDGESDHWLGATDQHQEGMWVWVDGTAVTLGTPFWAVEEPNDYHGNEDCLKMYKLHHGYFNDQICTDVYPFICQDPYSLP